MFLQVNHQKLQIFQVSQKFVFECYKLQKLFLRMKDLQWFSKSEGLHYPYT